MMGERSHRELSSCEKLSPRGYGSRCWAEHHSIAFESEISLVSYMATVMEFVVAWNMIGFLDGYFQYICGRSKVYITRKNLSSPVRSKIH